LLCDFSVVATLEEMGDFKGHIFPGSVFLFEALWWMVQFCWTKYFSLNKNAQTCTQAISLAEYQLVNSDAKSAQNGNGQAHSPPVVSTGRCVRGLAFFCDSEPMARVLLPIIGVIGEWYLAPNTGTFHDNNGVVAHYTHITLYSGYIFSGVMDVFHISPPFVTPQGRGHSFIVVAAIIEALVFSGHASMQDSIESHFHQLLVYSILGMAVCAAGEIFLPVYGQIFKLGRIFFCFLQGVMFWVIAYTLFVWNWDVIYGAGAMNPSMESAMRHEMMATLIFSWSAIIIMLLMWLAMWICAYVSARWYSRTRSSSVAAGRVAARAEDDEEVEMMESAGSEFRSSQIQTVDAF
jgi:hypothetical protein